MISFTVECGYCRRDYPAPTSDYPRPENAPPWASPLQNFGVKRFEGDIVFDEVSFDGIHCLVLYYRIQLKRLGMGFVVI